MQRNVALWIDHRQAVIAAVAGDKEDLTRIVSGLEKHVRFSSRQDGAEDSRDKRFEGHLNQYYDKVVSAIRDARSILILGPGEARHEVEKRLRDAGLGKNIAAVETADKMTDHQIAAVARQRFLE
jgi:stalled ribosome rescue protein Dom34